MDTIGLHTVVMRGSRSDFVGIQGSAIKAVSVQTVDDVMSSSVYGALATIYVTAVAVYAGSEMEHTQVTAFAMVLGFAGMAMYLRFSGLDTALEGCTAYMIFLFAVGCYHNALHGAWVYDDHSAISRNKDVWHDDGPWTQRRPRCAPTHTPSTPLLPAPAQG